MRKKKRETTKKRVEQDDLRRLTAEEYDELYFEYINPNLRRLSDEEYKKLEKEIPEIHK